MKPHPSIRKMVIVGGLAAAALLATWFGWRFYLGITDVVGGAEDRLRAMKLVCDLTAGYVEQSGGTSWPASWEDLKRITPERQTFAWPGDADRVRSMIEVDFSVRLEDVIKQTPATFDAIRPKPGHANYSFGAEYEDLLRRLNEAVRKRAGRSG